MMANGSRSAGGYRHTVLAKIWKYKWLYLMLMPVMVYFIIFKYIPMYRIVMAFQKYNPFKGILGSKWVGTDVFKKVLSNRNFERHRLVDSDVRSDEHLEGGRMGMSHGDRFRGSSNFLCIGYKFK